MLRDEEKLRAYYADAPEGLSLDELDLDRVPRHVSIIMDGNGRWATRRGLDRSRGHVAGVDALREAVTTSVRLGVDVFSVYAFSTENWNRPQREVELLMHLFATTLVNELPLFHQENVRLQDIPKSYTEAFSLILCNPPYERGGFAAADADKALCKKELSLTLEELCAAAARCLKFGGRFALVHRADRVAEVLCTLHAHRLEPKKLQFVAGKAGAKPYAVLVMAVKGGKPGTEVLPACANTRN